MTRRWMTWALLVGWPLLGGFGLLEARNRAVEQGNASMKAGKPEQALTHYDRALAELPTDRAVNFNRGTALAALGRHEEALQEFLRATEGRSGQLKASAFYNLGNAFFRTEKFGEAVEAYKRSLALDPGNLHAKWNLELALRRKKDEDEKKDQQKQDQQQKQDPQAGQKPQDQQGEGQQGQPPPEGQDQAKGQQPERQQPDPGQGQPPPEPPPGQEGKPPQADKNAEMREIDAVLDGLERSPKDLEQVRARLRAMRRPPPEKDW